MFNERRCPPIPAYRKIRLTFGSRDRPRELGIQGDAYTTEIIMDATSVLTELPNAVFAVVAALPSIHGHEPCERRPVAGTPEPLLPDDEGLVHYLVGPDVTARPGRVLLEFWAMDGETLAKSHAAVFEVLPGISSHRCGVPKDIIQRIIETGYLVQEAAAAIESTVAQTITNVRLTENGTLIVTDAQGIEHESGAIPTPTPIPADFINQLFN